MIRNLLTTAAALGLLATPALAGQITGSLGTPGYDVINAGGGSVEVTSSGAGGNALYGTIVGSYALGTMDGLFGPDVAAVFPAAPGVTQALSVAFGADSASGTVTWNELKDGSTVPDLIGSWNVATSNGDTTWLADWVAGENAAIDLVIKMDTESPSSIVGFATGFSDFGVVSTFEVSPGLIPHIVTSEPAAAGILALALLTLGIARKRQS